MVDGNNPESHQPTRREFLALGVGALVVASVPYASRRRTVAQRTIPVMGTVADLAVAHADRHYAEAAIDAAIERLRQVDRLMTRFNNGSDVGRTNVAQGRDGVLVTAETAAVLRAALAWSETTDGAFDPCLGTAIELWDVEHRHAPPPDVAVRRLAGRNLYRALDVDRWRGHPAARLSDRDARIDLGGIAKGFGVDQAVATLRDWGIHDALVNAGGDLYAMGRSGNGTPWRIGVRSPERADRLVAEFDLEDAAVATSGDYLQYFEYHGRRYHHLLDPRTAAPRITAMHSISVQAASCTTADAGATACFGQPRAVADSWAARRDARIIHSV
jgi:thiamine biosynthesis lipoprotein